MGNYEANLGIYDEAQATHMEDIFRTDLRNSRQLLAEEWNRRSLLNRFSERVLAPLHPLF